MSSAQSPPHTGHPDPNPPPATDISETQFKVTVTLDVPYLEDHEQPRFSLDVRYPDEYPDVPPDLEIQAIPNAPTHADFSVSDDRDQLLSGLDVTIQENIGMAMVFAIVSSLKEAAETLIQDRQDAANRAHEERILEAEREENKKFHGTPVTPETFMKWRQDFLREMEERRAKEEEERQAELKKAKVKPTVKLTGRQLWERGLAGKGDEDEGEDDDGVPTEGVQNLKVEAA